MISVVVPSFNRGLVIAQTLDSIVNQAYRRLECIVVDACSTDDTISILKAYEPRGVRWLSEPDRGAFEAINKGWERSQGEILTWLNADDCWEEDTAAWVADYFLRHPEVDVLYGACGVINGAGDFIEEYPARPWDLRYAIANCDHIINQASSFIRRRALDRVGFLYPAWCHDHDLWLRLGVLGAHFQAVSKRLANARIWQGNLGNSGDVVTPAKLAMMERLFATSALPSDLRALRRRAFSNTYLRGLDYRTPGEKKAWRLVTRALATDPLNAPRIAFRACEFLVKGIQPLYVLAKRIRRLLPSARAIPPAQPIAGPDPRS